MDGTKQSQSRGYKGPAAYFRICGGGAGRPSFPPRQAETRPRRKDIKASSLMQSIAMQQGHIHAPALSKTRSIDHEAGTPTHRQKPRITHPSTLRSNCLGNGAPLFG